MPTAVSTGSPRKTAVYIDGYNLYYGSLRETQFKWLDVVQLFDVLLAQRDQNEKLEKANPFTAPALVKHSITRRIQGVALPAIVEW